MSRGERRQYRSGAPVLFSLTANVAPVSTALAIRSARLDAPVGYPDLVDPHRERGGSA